METNYPIPDDVHRLILSNLVEQPLDILSSFFVCKKWHSFKLDSKMWASLFCQKMGYDGIEEAEAQFEATVLLFHRKIRGWLESQSSQKISTSTYNPKTDKWESKDETKTRKLDLKRLGPLSNGVFSELDAFQRLVFMQTSGTFKIDIFASSNRLDSTPLRGKIKLIPSEEYSLHITIKNLDSQPRGLYRGYGFHLEECDSFQTGSCVVSAASLTEATGKKPTSWSPYMMSYSPEVIFLNKIYRCGTGMREFSDRLEPGEAVSFSLPLRVVQASQIVESHRVLLSKSLISPSAKVNSAMEKPERFWLSVGERTFIAFPESGVLDLISIHQVTTSDGSRRWYFVSDSELSIKNWDCSLPLRIEYTTCDEMMKQL